MGQPDEILLRFRDWVAGRAGVFRRRDALSHGLTSHAISRGARRGEWYPYRGVWQVAGYPDVLRARAWAALLVSGSSAVVTGPTALTLYGMPIDERRVFIRTPAKAHPRSRGVVIFRPSAEPVSVRTVDGIPVVRRDEAAVDTIRLAPGSYWRDVFHESLRLGWLTPDLLAGWAERVRGCKGERRLIACAREAVQNVHAESERLAVAILIEAEICGWVANQPIRDQQGLIGIGDIVFDEQRLVVEIDGRAWHSDARRFQRDRARQNRLINAGWRVLRFTWEDLTRRPDTVVRTIRAGLDPFV